MIKIKYKGRLGNNLIQYAAAHVLSIRTQSKIITPAISHICNRGIYKTSCSKTPNLKINFGDYFNIPRFKNEADLDDALVVSDSNYFDVLYGQNDNVNNKYIVNGYFQDGRLLCVYRDAILDLYKNPYPNFSQPNNNSFIACRLGDSLQISSKKNWFCNLEYIEKNIIELLKLNGDIYITSDSINFPPLVHLIEKYKLKLYQEGPLQTILFASNFNNLVLSAGSFSYWMAYFSEAKNISVFKNNSDPLQRKNAWKYTCSVKFIN